ncbi:MAG TPA: hypothetical protein VMX57_09435, partial [Planctomycetota bacterium]|nr:hypothetical protein [Planctomycetota bacterium]
MLRRETTVLVVVMTAAVVVLAAVVAGRLFMLEGPRPEPVPAPGPPPGRTRYDCLIVREPAGPDDVVTSPGFPQVHSP